MRNARNDWQYDMQIQESEYMLLSRRFEYGKANLGSICNSWSGM